jgi:hypothetical protein
MRPIHPWKAWMVTVLLSCMCLGHAWCLVSQHCSDSTKKMRPGRWRPSGATTTTTTTALACATNRRDNHLDDVRSLLAAALAKMKIVQEEEERFFFQSSSQSSSSSLKALGQQMREAVEARESSIPNAGQGLFARQKIKAGTIVSLYPVHCLGVDFVEDTDDDLGDHSTVLRCYMDESDERYFDQQQQNSDDDDGAYLQFLLGSRPLLNTSVRGALLRGMPLFVDVNPQRGEPATTTSSCFLAHLVNDGSTVLHASEQGLLDYYVTSRQRKNCVFIPFGPAPILALVTTCPVRRGDELWTSYGANYWLDRLLAHGGDENEDEENNLVTDRVLALVRENARDILTSLRAAEVTHGDQLAALTRAYEAL